jgi:uncharacterized membrane protein YeaQ/YmgE (transglycosylase-associated protein family)
MRLSRIGSLWRLVLAVYLLLPMHAWAAEDPTLRDRANEQARRASDAMGAVVEETKTAVEEAGQSVASGFETLWHRVDESRLKNRTPDEILGWLMMGVLVGAVVGMMTSSKSGGMGKCGKLLLGLVGAILGGMLVHFGQFDFGWGPFLIRYEELLFAMLGAVLLVAVGWVVRARSRRKSAG